MSARPHGPTRAGAWRGGAARYAGWCKRPQRSLAEVLDAFPSVAFPTLAAFLEVCPRLQERYFTIASSDKQHPTSVHLTVSVVDVTDVRYEMRPLI